MHPDWWKPIYYKARYRATNKWFGIVSYASWNCPSRSEWIVPGLNWKVY